jgi:hypothetical protein
MKTISIKRSPPPLRLGVRRWVRQERPPSSRTLCGIGSETPAPLNPCSVLAPTSSSLSSESRASSDHDVDLRSRTAPRSPGSSDTSAIPR